LAASSNAREAPTRAVPVAIASCTDPRSRSRGVPSSGTLTPAISASVPSERSAIPSAIAAQTAASVDSSGIR
jgi:hypothetical protein